MKITLKGMGLRKGRQAVDDSGGMHLSEVSLLSVEVIKSSSCAVFEKHLNYTRNLI